MNPSKKKRQTRVQQRIVEAARNLVIENGFDNLSLRGIARRVDYSPAALYEYFESKDAIIEALCMKIDQHMSDFMMEALENSSLEHPLVRISLAYIQFALENPDDFRLLFFHNLYTSSGAQEIISEQVELSIDTGEFLPSFDFDHEEITHCIWSLAHGMAMLALCRDHYNNDLNIHREAITRLLDGLRV